MKKQIEQVRKFNTITGGPIKEDTSDRDYLSLKLGLIEEEVKELAMASYDKSGDKVEMLDALGDILYVVYGFAITYGLEKALPDAFHRIHKSNMSKFCDTEVDAMLSVDKYAQIGVETYYKKVDNLYVIYRKSDNKVLKAHNYSPVNLKDLV